MKRKRLLLASLLCVVCALFGLVAVACNSTNTYKVTFDVQGHGTAPAQIVDLESGATIEEPTAPTAEGYTFGGWYKETACENKWNFETDTVEGDTTLYAQWEANTYTLTYNVQGHGTAPDSKQVKYDSKLEEPTAPEAENYVFGGWYKEEACTNKWNFETDVVKGDVTLYANWLFTATYDVQGHGTAPAQVKDLVKGAKLEEPEAPAAEGFVFEGWYKEAACENEWDFDVDTVSDSMTLYAYWKQVHAVSLSVNTIILVEDYSYFDIPASGTYYVSVPRPEGTTENPSTDTTYKLDGVEMQKQSDSIVYLSKGRHTFTCTGAAFRANIRLSNIDLPFTETCTFLGETYQFVVSSTGYVNGEKVSAASSRLGLLTDEYGKRVTVSNIENGFYTISADGATYRMKLIMGLEGVTAIELYAQEGEGWAETPDTLHRAVNASEVVVILDATEAGSNISEEVEDTFEYVYFSVASLKGKWLEFSNLGDLTFWWVNVSEGRTGELGGQITIAENTPLLLDNDYYDHIAVQSASGTTVTFTLKLAEAPLGLSEDNPIEITEATTEMTDVLGGMKYYFTYDVETAGNYVICVSKTSWGSKTYTIYYTVNGDEYGYDGTTWTWCGGLSNDNPYAEIAFEAGTVSIVVTVGDWDNNFTIEIGPAPVYEVTTGKYQGTVEGKTYMFDVNKEESRVSLTLTVDGTAHTLADNVELTVNEGVYSFATSAVEGVAAAGTATFKVDRNGSLAVTAPAEFTAAPYVEASPLTAGVYKLVDEDTVYTLTITGDETNGYKASFRSTWNGSDDFNETNKDVVNNKFTFTYNDTEYEVTVTMNQNGTLHVVCDVFMFGSEADFQPEGSVDPTPVELEEGTYSGTDENDSEYTLVITQQRRSWLVDYTVDGESYGTGLNISYNEETDTYSFTYNFLGDDYEVTFTVTADSEGNLQLHVVDGSHTLVATSGDNGGGDEQTLDITGTYQGNANGTQITLTITNNPSYGLVATYSASSAGGLLMVNDYGSNTYGINYDSGKSAILQFSLNWDGTAVEFITVADSDVVDGGTFMLMPVTE